MRSAPPGATHTSDPYGVALFWSLRFDHVGERIDCWYYWSGKQWLRSPCTRAEDLKEIPC